MKPWQSLCCIALVLLSLVGCSLFAPAGPTPVPEPTSGAPATATTGPEEETAGTFTPAPPSVSGSSATPSRPVTVEAITPAPEESDPLALVSRESLLAFLRDLTAIQPYSGWRNSATEGESQALDWVLGELEGFGYLQDLGMELERQDYHVFLGTEQWESRLQVVVDGREVEVPADGLRGPRDEIGQALRFDSDGVLNDAQRDPVVVESEVVIVRSPDEVRSLRRRDVEGKIVLLDYEAVDKVVQGDTRQAVEIAWQLIDQDPAGLVLITEFSNQVGRSHGSFVADTNALNWVESDVAPPTLYARLEDLAPAGIEDWDDLARIESARLTWDADVFSPATSENLVVRIPGADPAQAMILGAHIDSPNVPGAMDDGSGSAVLLEVARVLDAARTQPPMDLYLVWFGSEELGLYGSAHFAQTHQELLDRTVAMLQVDCLTYPLDGIEAEISLVTWSYGRFGDDRTPWPDLLAGAAGKLAVETITEDRYYLYSDNTSFSPFDVPNLDVIYGDEAAMEATGSLHYAAHIHDPYDTVELAEQVGDVLEQMALVAVAGVLETPPDAWSLRVTPRPDRRVLFVASHTESIHMVPATLTDLGMAFAWEGYDVDTVPYGQAITAADLADADLVIALPVLDYPSPEGDVGLYDEAWTAAEIDALEGYVARGGLLVLTNSRHRLKYSNRVLDANEDWADANDLSAPFGITYQDGTIWGNDAQAEGDHALVRGVESLALAPDNGLPFTLTGGQILARAGGEPVVALVDYGDQGGQVLVLADLGLLGAEWGPPPNLTFWQNLARYAR